MNNDIEKYYELRTYGYDHIDAMNELNLSFAERVELEDELWHHDREKSAYTNILLVIGTAVLSVIGYAIGNLFI